MVDGGLDTFASIELGYIMASAVQLLFYDIDLSKGDQIVSETLRILLDLVQGHLQWLGLVVLVGAECAQRAYRIILYALILLAEIVRRLFSMLRVCAVKMITCHHLININSIYIFD